MKILLKLSSVAIAIILTCSLVSCSGNNSKKSDSEDINTPSKVETDIKSGYESEEYNLKFTPPEGYVMFGDSQMDAQNTNSGGTKYEMISEHSNGFPHVMVIAEKSDAENAEAYLGNLKSNFSQDTYDSSEITDYEIAGRSFKTFTLTTPDGITESFYAEKCGEEFLCIAVITCEGMGDGEQVLGAFSQIK